MSVEATGFDTAGISRLIADSLNEQDFSVQDPAEEGDRLLRVVNARQAYSQVIISDTGVVTWEYIPFDGRRADPGQLVYMILGILNGEPGTVLAAPRRSAGPTLRGMVGRTLRNCGMQVGLRNPPYNDLFCEVFADLVITSPSRPERGKVILTDEGMITWQCLLASGGSQGLSARDIPAIIGQVLGSVQDAGDPDAGLTGNRASG